MIKRLALLFFVCITGLSFSQGVHFRFTAGYTIKEIDTAGVEKISIGEVFLDKNQKNLFFYQEFPGKKQTKLRDTILSTYQSDTLAATLAIKGFYDMAIYNTILSSKLSDFGLRERGYVVNKVFEDAGKVIARYEPKDSTTFGNVELVTNSNYQLELVLVYLPDGGLVSKTFLSDYVIKKGLFVPRKIYQLAYVNKKVVKKITTLRNIKIDEEGNTHKYLD